MTDFDKESFNKDAMCNPLKIGSTYGFSVSSSGRTSTVIGTLTKISMKKATLEIIKRHHFLYGERHSGYGVDAATVSVQSCKLFPISIE